MTPNDPRAIFRAGSTTYYYSAIFFPTKLRRAVFTLYSFVRTADNYVDQLPSDRQSFDRFVRATHQALQGRQVHNSIITSFVELSRRYHFDPDWTSHFFQAMRSDLHPRPYRTWATLSRYIYGSDEVIGLFMAQLMHLPEPSHHFARQLGHSMQLINFIRDVHEDACLGRCYLPLTLLSKYGFTYTGFIHLLRDTHPSELTPHTRRRFSNLLRAAIRRYRMLDQAAQPGFHFLPRRYRIPIATAAEMYRYTAQRLYANPLLVYETKVKPTKTRIIFTILKHSLLTLLD